MNKTNKTFLIIEKNKNGFYAYRESEQHFNNVEPSRIKKGTRLKQCTLDEECDLSMLPDESHIVFEITNENTNG
jgi:hypothetical protein